MHSSEMKVSSTWLQDFQIKIQNFLNEFKNIPEIEAVHSRIEQVKCLYLNECWDYGHAPLCPSETSFNSSGIQTYVKIQSFLMLSRAWWYM